MCAGKARLRAASPLPHRLSGGYAVVVALIITRTAGFGVYAGLASVAE